MTTEQASTHRGDSEGGSYRIQSAMVLFALEEALGSFVVQAVPEPNDLPLSIRSAIENRMQGVNIVAVGQIVQETYIKEVIDLAVNASLGRSDNDLLQHLRQLVTSLDVFEIRNSVCHPNRLFPECYWYRMAALATDPCIEQLRLRKVTDAFRCAIEGRLTPPPDGWLMQRPWNVPNNLPSTFDHQVTGLIARKTEAKDLLKRIQNLRNSLVAIVGPGGTGKTALCLDLLRECLLDPLTLKWADEIVYVSAKTEQLTAFGVEPIANPVDSLDLVKEIIAKALLGINSEDISNESSNLFDDVSESMKDRRVLLCIDNLETLLRDHPQQFEDFIQSLPIGWRVLVTSRVSVNGANVLPLASINKEGAAKLARDYVSLRGAGRLEEIQVTRLIEVCDRNPLAIRLVIDSYAAGSELSTALAQTKDRITDFSYTALVDHLHPNANKVLECLYGSSEALSRAQIVHLLDLTPDNIAEAVNSLLRTSLVTRNIEGTTERYVLSSSVRELLLRTPRDASVRNDVYSRLRKQQRVIAELDRKGIKDPLDESFVSPTSPDYLRALVARVRLSTLGRSSRVNQVSDLREVKRSLELDNSQPILYRTEALILEQLGDRYGAIEAFGRAVSFDGSDACSRLRLAELLRDENRLVEAIDQTTPLILSGYLNNSTSTERNRTRLFRTHWVSVLWLKRYDEVLSETENWRERDDLRQSYVALRVSALQRYLDDGPQSALDSESIISEIFFCLSEAFRLDGYLADVVHEGFKAIERLVRIQDRTQLTEKSQMECAFFLNEHLAAMCATSYDYSLSDNFVIDLITAFRAVGANAENPLISDYWNDLVSRGITDDAALASVGYESARIATIFTNKDHLFARALDGSRDFFVRLSATELTRSQFSALKVGQLIEVLPGELPAGSRAWPAKHAMIG
ncbi:MAG: NB-ARC domain-containing protein [Capsulimonas sp.]|uniref:tetratricopeptide repeat protein n=1 Tax=Capsulimonas sp. TaxID=2494211 RepID=UPI00326487EE